MDYRLKRSIWAVLTILFLITAALIGRAVILRKVRSTIQEELADIHDKGYVISYDTIYLDWRRNLLVIEKFVIQRNSFDTTCLQPEFLSAGEVRLKGLGLFSLLFKKLVSFKSLVINDPHLTIRRHSSLLPDSGESAENGGLDLHVHELRLNAVRIDYYDSGSCNLLTNIQTDIFASQVSMHGGEKSTFKTDLVSVYNTTIQLPRHYYNLNVRKASLDFSKRSIVIDTFRVIPQLSKVAFGQQVGREIDRVDGVIPYVRFNDVDLSLRDSIFFRAAEGNIQGFVKFFRDKRLLRKKVYKPLPHAQLRSLPFGIVIDTLKIEKSYIEYEEFPEDSEVSGRVYFDDLYGVIANINSDSRLTDGTTTVDAKARFMGAGHVRMHSVFPWKTDSPCLTEGTLTNMDLPSLNPILEPMANMKIESGNLESLTFRFTYNTIRARGTAELNYRDLRVVSFKDEEKIENLKKRARKKDPEALRKDNFKTFIINAFVIRRNLTDKVASDKRTGDIDFQRDETRSIFNYWWKSVFSGVKSAYNISTEPAPAD